MAHVSCPSPGHRNQQAAQTWAFFFVDDKNLGKIQNHTLQNCIIINNTLQQWKSMTRTRQSMNDNVARAMAIYIYIYIIYLLFI